MRDGLIVYVGILNRLDGACWVVRRRRDTGARVIAKKNLLTAIHRILTMSISRDAWRYDSAIIIVDVMPGCWRAFLVMVAFGREGFGGEVGHCGAAVQGFGRWFVCDFAPDAATEDCEER